MTFAVATIVELLIVEAFVFFIWLKVLFEGMRDKDGSLLAKKIILTSLGLVFTSIAIVGLMVFRLFQLTAFQQPIGWIVIILYVVLAIGGIMFMVSAALGNNGRYFKAFLLTTLVWSLYCLYSLYF